jgi:general secretion pathway protein G
MLKLARAKRPLSASDGFSLMELLVVLAIMGLLAGLVLPRVMGALGKAKIDTTKTQVDQLSAALDFFQVDNGRYPNTGEGLEALIKRPDGLATWNGPYLAKNEIPLDGWHHPFIYQADQDADGYSITSLGADGKPGGTGANADVSRSTLAQSNSTPDGMTGATP